MTKNDVGATVMPLLEIDSPQLTSDKVVNNDVNDVHTPRHAPATTVNPNNTGLCLLEIDS